MRAELEDGDRALCVATGGMADVLAGETTAIQRVEPDLTLQGLRMIWARSAHDGEPGMEELPDYCRADRDVSVPEERRPPRAHRRTCIREGASLGERRVCR